MKFDPEKHHRRSIRLKEYDYSQVGSYFVTICTYQKQCWFGDIRRGEMQLNQIGKIVANEWLYSVKMRQEIDLDEWIIMPNHLHGIVILTDNQKATDFGTRDEGARHALLGKGARHAPLHQKSCSLSSFIAGFKAAVTKRINVIHQAPGFSIWQRNYYESIIRDEKHLKNIQQYILNNPQNWDDDPEKIQKFTQNIEILIDLPF
ncbi:MAG: transposase [Hydrococcus sp. Prado102]|nr:transposase [Hydrococcus sp. Prado102]